jgi:hypothetical protein
MAEKNKRWEAALKTAGNNDYTLRILPKANHAQFEAAGKQRRGAVVAAIRAGLLHDHPGLARETNPMTAEEFVRDPFLTRSGAIW